MSDSDCSSNNPQDSSSDDRPSKRRKSNPKTWKRNKLPALKVMGKEHVGWKGQVVAKRITGDDCR